MNLSGPDPFPFPQLHPVAQSGNIYPYNFLTKRKALFFQNLEGLTGPFARMTNFLLTLIIL
jgi:hypothetical protein